MVPYLRHKDWDTRATAAKALGKIIENAPLYDPNEDEDQSPTKQEPLHENSHVKKEEVNEPALPLEDYFTPATLDVSTILKYGR